MDGTQSLCKRRADKTSYQGRNKSFATKIFIHCQEDGTLLACFEPNEGKHNDLFSSRVPLYMNDSFFIRKRHYCNEKYNP
jgi:hypothetical protein